MSIGPLEVFVILVVALLVVGPQRLPRIARDLGRAMSHFRQAYTNIKDEINQELDVLDEEEKSGQGKK